MISYTLKLGGMNLETFCMLAESGREILVSQEVEEGVRSSRQTLDTFVAQERVIYGVNTSTGGFVDMLVPIKDARTFQENLINAVATNVGEYFDSTTTRGVMLARIVSLSRGNSAISLENFSKLVSIYNAGILPCIPEKGSLGTSGDLGPLAAIALVCCGQWRARVDGSLLSGREALEDAGIEPMALSYKEGLALINGTSAMVALGALLVNESRKVLMKYISLSGLSIEVLKGASKPYEPKVHELKPHKGQLEVARRLWRSLSGSQLVRDEGQTSTQLANETGKVVIKGSEPIEDTYSLRCTPQVLGPVWDAIKSAWEDVENELNSSNDNPLVISESNDVWHNGHFHGQYMSMAMDRLVVALITICNLSERRTDKMLTEANSNGLPAFLCKENPGLRLGLMGIQFLSTSLTAENRALATPVSIQTLSSTGGFQDIVSMGLIAARRAREVLTNTKYVIGVEAICASQAADIRGVAQLGDSGKRVYRQVRQSVPYLDKDIVLTAYIEELFVRFFEENSEEKSQQAKSHPAFFMTGGSS